MRRLYLDNAATSFPKPPEVLAAIVEYATQLGASAGRGAYAEAIETGKLIATCRDRINSLIRGSDPNQVVFTLNCSDALNLAIGGLIDPRQGGHVVCTAADHNSILRPVHEMAARGWITFDVVPIDPQSGLVDPSDVRRAIRRDTRAVCVTHASNVTGTLQPLREIAAIARECAVPIVVDAAQSIGHAELDVNDLGIDLLAAPGHKALMGPLGTGFLYLRPGLERIVRTTRWGGTGSVSEQPTQPTFMPDQYEPGSHNAIGIAGLSAGVGWLLQRGMSSVESHERSLMKSMIDGFSSIDGLRYFGPQDVCDRVGVFSVAVDGLTPHELAGRLEREFGILTRAGLHCAPLIHETLGTARAGGSTRLSVGVFTSVEDVRYATDALGRIAATARSATGLSAELGEGDTKV